MKKRIFTMLMAATLAATALSGCGKDASKETKKPEKPATEESDVNEPEEKPEEEAKPEEVSWEYGTTGANASNYSLIAVHENRVYYMSYGDGTLEMADLSNHSDSTADGWGSEVEITQLTTESANNINVVNDKVYFVQGYDNASTCAIMSMNPDGSNIQMVYKGYVDNLFVVNEWAYFLNKDTQAIERVGIDGQNHEVLLDKKCYCLNVYEGKIYFQDDADNESLYSMNLDGTDAQKLIDAHVYTNTCKDGKLYYVGHTGEEGDNYLYSMNLDGTSEPEQISDIPVNNFNFVGDAVIFNHPTEYGSGCGYAEAATPEAFASAKMDVESTREGFSTCNFKQMCTAGDYVSMFYDIVNDINNPTESGAGYLARIWKLDKNNPEVLKQKHDFSY